MESTITLHPSPKPSSIIAPAAGPAVSTSARKRKLLGQVRQAVRTPK
jgi:hypothetical protein